MINEVIPLALALERKKIGFYHRAKETVSSPSLKGIFLKLEEEEREHQDKLLSIEIPALPEEIIIYLRSLTQDQEEKEILDEAINWEKSSCIFYTLLKKYNPLSSLIQQILEDEKRHLVTLTTLYSPHP